MSMSREGYIIASSPFFSSISSINLAGPVSRSRLSNFTPNLTETPNGKKPFSILWSRSSSFRRSETPNKKSATKPKRERELERGGKEEQKVKGQNLYLRHQADLFAMKSRKNWYCYLKIQKLFLQQNRRLYYNNDKEEDHWQSSLVSHSNTEGEQSKLKFPKLKTETNSDVKKNG